MRVYIIIVTYNPNLENLNRIINCAVKCDCMPVIVDNSNEFDIKKVFLHEKCHYICMNGNMGIARAQNKGIEYAIANSADIIGFFDQDSMVDELIIKKLINALNNKNIQIVVPVSYDSITGSEYPNQIIGVFHIPKDVFSNKKRKISKIDIAISSGTMLKSFVISKVGLFDEDFFIDFVDIEWCVRCYKNKIHIWVVNTAKMNHKIGEKNLKRGILTINKHSPYRTYYKVRNAFLLFRKHVWFMFCIRQLIPAIIQNFVLIFDRIDGINYRKFYIQGIVDGLRGRGGKYEIWHK